MKSSSLVEYTPDVWLTRVYGAPPIGGAVVTCACPFGSECMYGDTWQDRAAFEAQQKNVESTGAAMRLPACDIPHVLHHLQAGEDAQARNVVNVVRNEAWDYVDSVNRVRVTSGVCDPFACPDCEPPPARACASRRVTVAPNGATVTRCSTAGRADRTLLHVVAPFARVAPLTLALLAELGAWESTRITDRIKRVPAQLAHGAGDGVWAAFDAVFPVVPRGHAPAPGDELAKFVAEASIVRGHVADARHWLASYARASALRWYTDAAARLADADVDVVLECFVRTFVGYLHFSDVLDDIPDRVCLLADVILAHGVSPSTLLAHAVLEGCDPSWVISSVNTLIDWRRERVIILWLAERGADISTFAWEGKLLVELVWASSPPRCVWEAVAPAADPNMPWSHPGCGDSTCRVCEAPK